MSSTILIVIAIMVALGLFAVASIDAYALNIGEAKSSVGQCASTAKNNSAAFCHELL